MNNKIFIIVSIILVTVAVVANIPSKFDSESEIQMSSFPKAIAIGEWKGEDIPLDKSVYELLETKNLIMREYKNAQGDSVYLYIIYSVGDRRTMHPPEICYTGGGASTITEKSVIQITDSIKANRFIIEARDSRQLVAYWFKSANLNTYSYVKQQFKIVTDRMLRKKTYGAMIRVSAEIKDKNADRALGLIKMFTKAIEPQLQKMLP